MNVLITGALGQLGRSINRCVPHDTLHNYIFTDKDDLDITSPSDVERFLDDNDVDIVVNCAAYTDVEKAESDKSAAYILNADAPGILASILGKRGGYLIHISTDYVFGGTPAVTPIAEDVECCPTGVYGWSKLEGERAIERSGVNAIVLRTSWLYSEYGKNFVKTMRTLTSSRDELKVVVDQIGSPTYATDLARLIVDIIEHNFTRGYEGTYNFSDEGVASWYDFAVAIASESGNEKCDIKPCKSNEYPSAVKRPSYSVLDKSKVKNSFGITIPHWTVSLKRCIENLNKQ